MTYDVHQGEEIVLHVLLAVKPNHRVVNSEQDFDVVVVHPGVTATTTAAANRLIDLPGHCVKSPENIELRFCAGDQDKEGYSLI